MGHLTLMKGAKIYYYELKNNFEVVKVLRESCNVFVAIHQLYKLIVSFYGTKDLYWIL